MKNWSDKYFSQLEMLFHKIEVWLTPSQPIGFGEGLQRAYQLINNCRKQNKKIIFIGNGASASISSHQAVDYWKRGGVKAISLNDAAMLTCMGNDFGYEKVFSKPIQVFSDREDLLIAISSSGKSPNILAGAISARKNKCAVITLSGMTRNNPLSRLGDLNFFIPSPEYGHVEIIHLSILHCIVDYLVANQIQ